MEKIFKEIVYFHYITYMATLYRKNPCPGGHESYNFGRPFLGHHHYIYSLSDLCLGVKKKIFTQKITSPWGRGRSWNLQFLVSLPYRCYILNLVKICPISIWEDFNGRRTPTHCNRSPESLRWPKKCIILNLVPFPQDFSSKLLYKRNREKQFPSKISRWKFLMLCEMPQINQGEQTM